MNNQQVTNKAKMIFVFDPISKKMRIVKASDKKTKIPSIVSTPAKGNKD